MSFDEYKREVIKELSAYGIGINDCTNEDAIWTSFKDGDETPKQFVEWIAEHYQLTKLKDVQ